MNAGAQRVRELLAAPGGAFFLARQLASRGVQDKLVFLSQVVGQQLEPPLHAVARQTTVPHPLVPVGPLQRPKDFLHLRPDGPDQRVVSLLPRR